MRSRLAQPDGTVDAMSSVSVCNEKNGAVVGEHMHLGSVGVSRNGAEIEGHGTIPFSEDLQCYRLYGRLSQMDIGELKIGYGFTDFVVEDASQRLSRTL